jgi:hypothetical protein
MATDDAIPIRISLDGKVIEVDRKKAVKKTKDENVKWVAQNGGGPWVIKFNKVSAVGANYPVEPGSPFEQDKYTVPRGGEKATERGPVKGKVKKTYRYTVNDEQENPTDDPDVDVE